MAGPRRLAVRFEETRYDIAGRRRELEDANQNVTAYAYDAASRLTLMTYPPVAGEPENVEGYVYDNTGLLITKTTPNGVPISYTYDDAGRLSTVSFPVPDDDPRTITYNRDDGAAVTSIADTDSVSVGYSYDVFGRVTSHSDSGADRALSYAYDKRGLRTRMTLGGTDGFYVDYTYDAAARLSTVQRDIETTPAVYGYDAAGRRISLLLPNGVNTTYDYTGNDQLDVLTTKDPAEVPLASFDYDLDDTGNRTGITYADGSTSTYGFDDAYRLTSEHRRDAAENEIYTQTFAYDDVGNRTRMTGRNVVAYRAAVDTMLLYHLDEPAEATTVADASGNGHDGTVAGATLGHDGRFGKAAQFVGTSGSQIEIPDSTDLQLGSGDFTIEASVYVWDVGATTVDTILSKWTAETGVDERSWKLSIVEGVLTLELSTDGTNVTTISATTSIEANTWTHVAAVRSGDTVTLYIDNEDVGSGTFAGSLFNAAGGDVRLIGASGDAASPDYFDGLIDEVRVSASDRSSKLNAVDVAYTYNARNQLVTEISGMTVKTYAYDNNGNTTGWQEYSGKLEGGSLVRTANDDKSLTTSDHLTLSLSDASTVYVAYDPRATTLPTWLASDWRKIGRLDVQTTDPYQDWLDVYAREYDAGEFTLGGNLAGGAAGAETNYVVLVPQGAQVTVVSVSSGKAYDVVTAAESAEYYIDRTYSIAGFGGAVEVATVTMAYDQLNRMTKYTGPEGTEEFAYRGAEWHRCAAETLKFVYDGDNVVADVVAGDVGRTYVTPFLDQNLSMTASGAAYYYSSDGLVTVRTVTDATGSARNAYDYLAFGETRGTESLVTVPQRYCYEGREAYRSAPLLYYRFRPYSPIQGRMLNRNRWGYTHRNFSLYDALNQNPVVFTEPFSWPGRERGLPPPPPPPDPDYYHIMMAENNLAAEGESRLGNPNIQPGSLEHIQIAAEMQEETAQRHREWLESQPSRPMPWDPLQAAVWAAVGEHDVGVEGMALFWGRGRGYVECCNDKNQHIRASYEKTCWGLGLGGSVGMHPLSGGGVEGKLCPMGYAGVFYEATFTTPFGGVSGETTVSSSTEGFGEDDIIGFGPSASVGLFAQLAKCEYTVFNPRVVGCCDSH